MRKRAARRGLLGALLLSLCATPLAAGQSRIVQGQPAEQGEYPAAGHLRIQVAPGITGACGGTLITPRRFLTAGHCVKFQNAPLPPSSFRVTLGERDLRSATSEDFWFASDVEVHPQHVSNPVTGGERFDVAMLTLNRRAPFTPLPIVPTDRNATWGDGVPATIVGWGATSFNGPTSPVLLENAGAVPMRSDAECETAYGLRFARAVMVCAGEGTGDTCQGDSGGALMVRDGGLVQAGVTSFGDGCNDPGAPGVYARVGADPLNAWVLDHSLDFDPPAAPRATEAGTFTAIPAQPVGQRTFDAYRWDFDDDGSIDATGPNPSHAFPSPGRYTVELEGDRRGETFRTRQAVDVGAPPPAPVAAASAAATPAPVIAPRKRYLTLLAPSRLRVDSRRRFRARVRFLSDAPAGRAVVQARRGASRLGRASLAVRRGQTRTVRVALTRSAYRRLGRAKGRRLKVQLRVSLGGVVKRKTVTLLRR